jgi:hypothetical protein
VTLRRCSPKCRVGRIRRNKSPPDLPPRPNAPRDRRTHRHGHHALLSQRPTSSQASSFRPVMTTLAPASAKPSAMERPSPLLEPVTMAAFPRRSRGEPLPPVIVKPPWRFPTGPARRVHRHISDAPCRAWPEAMHSATAHPKVRNRPGLFGQWSRRVPRSGHRRTQGWAQTALEPTGRLEIPCDEGLKINRVRIDGQRVERSEPHRSKTPRILQSWAAGSDSVIRRGPRA